MKLEDIYKFIVLLEYRKKDYMTLSAEGGERAHGKSYDRIAAGVTKPYTNKDTRSKYEKMYPNLGNITQQLKKSSLGGNKIVTGLALAELKDLLSTFDYNQDVNGVILPLGDNMRLKAQGGNYFIFHSKTDPNIKF